MILDWVPAHFAVDDWALTRFDGTALYEHADPRRGAHPDWGTLVFNYGRHEVRNFLVANALYWIEEFHADGLRVDGVASMLYLDYSRAPGEWVPNRYGGREDLEAVQFLQELNAVVHATHPGVSMIAEESTAWPGVSRPTETGGLGFTFKWNLGWMHDTLGYVAREPIHRRWHHDDLTFSLVYAWDENFVLPLSHDEVVHGKGLAPPQAARATSGSSSRGCARSTATCGRTPASSSSSWAASSGREPSGRRAPRSTGTCSTTRSTRACAAAWPTSTASTGPSPRSGRSTSGPRASSGSSATPARTTRSPTFAARRTASRVLACLVNFSPVVRHHWRLPLPAGGRWREVLNTDASEYGGSGTGNLGGVEAVGGAAARAAVLGRRDAAAAGRRVAGAGRPTAGVRLKSDTCYSGE